MMHTDYNAQAREMLARAFQDETARARVDSEEEVEFGIKAVLCLIVAFIFFTVGIGAGFLMGVAW
jgi:hypothetical protein